MLLYILRLTTSYVVFHLAPVTNVYGLFRNDWGTESSFIDSPQIIWRANSSEGIGCAAFVDGSVDEPEVQVIWD